MLVFKGVIYLWKTVKTKDFLIAYRKLNASHNGYDDYYEYCKIANNPFYTYELPLKRIVTAYELENVIKDIQKQERQQVKIMSTDYNGTALKPKEIKGVNMIDSFKCNERDKTIQVFTNDSDVYIKDNSFFSVQSSSPTYSDITGDWNGTTTSWYAVATWVKIEGMNTCNGISMNKFIREYVGEVRQMLGCIDSIADFEIKAETTYSGIMNIIQ